MTIWESILLGILQGLTEFLPISSSGHLFLAEILFGFESSLSFVCFLHFGTLVAVVLFYFDKIALLLKKPKKDKKLSKLVVATLCTLPFAVAIKLLFDDSLFRFVLPFGFLASILLLTTSSFVKTKKRTLKRMPLWNFAVCGIVQGFAVLPGLSRSGSTISTLKFFGLNDNENAEFSFLLSIPIIIASCAVECFEVFSADASSQPWFCILVGVLTSFVVGFASIKFFVSALQKNTFLYFAFYLVFPFLLSLLVL